MVTEREMLVGGMNWEVWIGIYTLLYTKSMVKRLTTEHGKIYSILCDSLYGKKICEKEWICVGM